MNVPGKKASGSSISPQRREPSRGGCFSPPAFRPRFCRRAPPAETQIQQLSSLKNSNRECKRLEIIRNQPKRTTPTSSNREKSDVFATRKWRPHLRPNGDKNPPKRCKKSKSAPPKSVAIKPDADALFSVSYGRF